MSSTIHSLKGNVYAKTTPLEQAYQWALIHGAERQYLEILSNHIFKCRNSDLEIEIDFCDTPEGSLSRADYNNGKPNARKGDFSAAYIIRRKRYGFREDHIYLYRWSPETKKWAKNESVEYYAKSGFLGDFTFLMPKDHPQIRDKIKRYEDDHRVWEYA